MQNIEKLNKKIGVHKIAISYSPVISRISNIYSPNNNTIYVEQYQIAVGDTNGNPPNPNEPTWTIENNMSILFSGNQLVNAGNPTSITRRTVNRANQINRTN